MPDSLDSQTDNRLYDPKLSPNEIQGNSSGKPDDRWAWTRYTTFNQYGAAASLAAASRVLRGWNDPLPKECLDTAIKLWNDEKSHPAPKPPQMFPGMGSADWQAALELMIAADGAEPYKQRVEEQFPSMLSDMGFCGWTVVRALPYLNASYKTRFKAALQARLPELNRQLDATPFGVPPTRGDWDGAEQVADFGAEMYFLHEAFPTSSARSIPCAQPITCSACTRFPACLISLPSARPRAAYLFEQSRR